MNLHPVFGHGRLLAALVLAGAVAAPSAHAAGFSQPVGLAGGDDASAVQVAIAPNGRTAVLYLREVGGVDRERYEYRAAFGPSPDRLGRPTTVQAGSRAAGSYEGGATLMARPDGGFVACFPDNTRHKARRQGCSIAEPTGTFGPLHLVGTGQSMSPAMRPDGSTVVLLSDQRSRPDGTDTHYFLTVASMSTGGQVTTGPTVERGVDETVYSYGAPSIAVIADGTVAIPASVAIPGEKGGHTPGIRLMAPGADQFGPVIPVGTERYLENVSLTGGPELLISFRTAGSTNYYAPSEERVVLRHADGTFAPALTLPGGLQGEDKVNIFGVALPQADGGLFGITSRVATGADDSDCFDPRSGQVAAGTFGAPGPATPSTRLSAQGQIALDAQAVQLADGTVIASWENAAGYGGETRLETAVRPAGAAKFGKPKVLPLLNYERGSTLVAGGNQAALVWRAARRDHSAQVVVSTYRTRGPYAKLTALPRHPAAPCDE